MPLSVRLSKDEEQLLDITSNRLGKNKSELVRQAVYELCQKLANEEQSAYSLGEDLFDQGELSLPPESPLKKQLWEKLHVKHGYTS